MIRLSHSISLLLSPITFLVSTGLILSFFRTLLKKIVPISLFEPLSFLIIPSSLPSRSIVNSISFRLNCSFQFILSSFYSFIASFFKFAFPLFLIVFFYALIAVFWFHLSSVTPLFYACTCTGMPLVPVYLQLL